MSRPADLLLRLGDTTPAWPTAGQISLYAKTDGVFYKLDANGNETPLIGGGAPGGGTGTVTRVDAIGASGVLVSGGPVTNTGTFTIGLGDITPTSVVASGTIMASNLVGMNTGDETINSIKSKLGITVLSGDNTGDQTITLTGDVTGSGTGTFAATLTNVNPNVGTFGSNTKIPIITVDAKGRVTAVTAYDVSVTSDNIIQALGYTPYNNSNPAGYTTNTGTVTSVDAIGLNGILVNGGPITGAGGFTLRLGDITPSSVSTPGNIVANNLSGVNTGDETKTSILTKLEIHTISGINTGDQTITLTGDVIGSGTGTFSTNLAVVNTNIGTFGSSTQIPVVTVDDKGRVTGISTVALGAQAVAGVSTFNSRIGDVTLTHADIVTALGYTPYDSANPHSYSDTQGTVTYLEVQGEDGIEVNGSPITTTGTISLHLTDIKPFSVAASGTVTGTNLSGVNTGDQTITLTGDVTGSGMGLFETTLSDVGVVPGTYGTPTKVPHITVDSKGRVIRIAHIDIASTGTGSVTSVGVSGGTTGLTTLGGPVTGAGVITLDGTLAIEHGGTNATTANDALNNLLPDQVAKDGYVLTTDGANTYWQAVTGTGTVTGISASGADGITVIVNTPTTTPEVLLGLGDITPTSVQATGTITGQNLSGTNTGDETAESIRTKLGITVLSGANTGDQTITLTGDVTGSGTGTFDVTLANVNPAPVNNGLVKITVNEKGLVTATSAISNTDIFNLLGYTPYSSDNPQGYTSNTGTVTSVNLSGGTTGLTALGGPITDSGVITLGGKLAIEHGGTGADTANDALNNLLPDQAAKGGYVLATDGTNVSWISAGTGTVTSVDLSGGTTGLTALGGPITDSGVITLGGTLAIEHGGTGADTANDALNNLLPDQAAKGGYVLATDGTNVSWISAGTGTVTSVGLTGSDGVIVSGGTITETGVFDISLGDITPLSVSASGTVYASNISGTNTGDETAESIKTKLGITVLSGANTGDQTITLTGDVTGSGTGTFSTQLSDTGVTPGTYSLATVTVDGKGRVTGISSGPAISGTGTVTSVGITSPSGTVDVSGGPITDSGVLQVDLPQTGVAAGTYTNATVTVDEYGRVTNISQGTGSTASTYEQVVFKYTSGSGGTLAGADCLVSTTPGVTAVITDGTNSIVRYSFTGHTNLPKTVTLYGQAYTLNEFVVSDLTSIPLSSRRIVAGGTADNPAILTGLTSANTMTLQHRMSDSGASAGLGQRAHMIIVFGF